MFNNTLERIEKVLKPSCMLYCIHSVLAIAIMIDSIHTNNNLVMHWFVFILPSIFASVWLIISDWNTRERYATVIASIISIISGLLIPIGIFAMWYNCRSLHNYQFKRSHTVAVLFAIVCLQLVGHTVLYAFTATFHDKNVICSFILFVIFVIILVYPKLLEVLSKMPSEVLICVRLQLLICLLRWYFCLEYINNLLTVVCCIFPLILTCDNFEINHTLNNEKRRYYYQFVMDDLFVCSEDDIINKCYCIIGDIHKHKRKSWYHLCKFIGMNQSQKLHYLGAKNNMSTHQSSHNANWTNNLSKLILICPFILLVIRWRMICNTFIIIISYLIYIGYYFYYDELITQTSQTNLSIVLVKMISDKFNTNSELHEIVKEDDLKTIYHRFKVAKSIFTSVNLEYIGLIILEYICSDLRSSDKYIL
eukprot:163559_1